MKRLGLFFALAILCGLSSQAASLAPDLAYVRAGTDPATIAKLLETGSVVIDLRYVEDGAAVTAMIDAIHAAPADPRRIFLVLISPETASFARLNTRRPGKILVIGRASSEFKPDITVSTSAEADRRSFDTIAAGTPPEKLLIEGADKPRFDESALIKEHLGADVAYPAAQPSAKETDTDLKPAVPSVDAVLQRAVHIHRGLIVMNKL